MSAKAQAWIVAVLLGAILAIAVLVVASVWLTYYTRDVCTSLNHGFSYVRVLNTQRIVSLEQAINTDRKAGRNLKVRDERVALGKAQSFQDNIVPPHC